MTQRYFFKSSLSFLAALLMFGAAQAQPMNPPDMDKMMNHHVNQIVEAAHATPDQKAKLMAIAKAAHADLKPLHEQAKAAREQMMSLIAAPTIDRAAIEQQRLQQTKIMDLISQRMNQAMIESAEVLTPDQRAQVASQMKNRSMHMMNQP